MLHIYALTAFTDSHRIFIFMFKLQCQSMNFSALASFVISGEKQMPPENYAFHPETEFSDVPLSHCLEITFSNNYNARFDRLDQVLGHLGHVVIG